MADEEGSINLPMRTSPLAGLSSVYLQEYVGQRGRVQSLHRGCKLVPDVPPDTILPVREGGATLIFFLR